MALRGCGAVALGRRRLPAQTAPGGAWAQVRRVLCPMIIKYLTIKGRDQGMERYMSEHPSAVLVVQAYDAMGRGDIPWLQDHTHADVVFHQTGRFPTAGTYRGRDALFGHFMEFMQLVGGDFKIDVHDVLANDEHVTALIRVTVGRDGKQLEFEEVHVFHVRDGLLTEMWAIPQDPYSVDEFFK
jgi:uncharacterized protein